MDIKGTINKQSATDEPKKCDGCGKLFYAGRIHGVWVICPHCGRKH